MTKDLKKHRTRLPADAHFKIEGDRPVIDAHPGLGLLKGLLASKKGERMSFAQIREAAARARIADRDAEGTFSEDHTAQ